MKVVDQLQLSESDSSDDSFSDSDCSDVVEIRSSTPEPTQPSTSVEPAQVQPQVDDLNVSVDDGAPPDYFKSHSQFRGLLSILTVLFCIKCNTYFISPYRRNYRSKTKLTYRFSSVASNCTTCKSPLMYSFYIPKYFVNGCIFTSSISFFINKLNGVKSFPSNMSIAAECVLALFAQLDAGRNFKVDYWSFQSGENSFERFGTSSSRGALRGSVAEQSLFVKFLQKVDCFAKTAIETQETLLDIVRTALGGVVDPPVSSEVLPISTVVKQGPSLASVTVLNGNTKRKQEDHQQMQAAKKLAVSYQQQLNSKPTCDLNERMETESYAELARQQAKFQKHRQNAQFYLEKYRNEMSCLDSTKVELDRILKKLFDDPLEGLPRL